MKNAVSRGVDPDEDLLDLLALGDEEAVLAHLGYELGKDFLALALVQREHVGGLSLEEIDDAIGAATSVLEVLDVPRRDGECLGHPCPPACSCAAGGSLRNLLFPHRRPLPVTFRQRQA